MRTPSCRARSRSAAHRTGEIAGARSRGAPLAWAAAGSLLSYARARRGAQGWMDRPRSHPEPEDPSTRRDLPARCVAAQHRYPSFPRELLVRQTRRASRLGSPSTSTVVPSPSRNTARRGTAAARRNGAEEGPLRTSTAKGPVRIRKDASVPCGAQPGIEPVRSSGVRRRCGRPWPCVRSRRRCRDPGE